MPEAGSRYVTIYDMSISPARIHGAGAVKVSVSDFGALARAVKAAAKSGKLLSDTPDARGRSLYLMDLQLFPAERWIASVWTVADPSAAAQMYMSRDGAKLRAAPKAADEDVALSGHLIIDFDTSDDTVSYMAALEDHEGISRSRINSMFTGLLRTYLPSVTAIVAAGIAKTGQPTIRFESHQGKLMNGTERQPFEIEMVKRIPRKELMVEGAPPFVMMSERRVFRLAHKGTAAQLRELALSFVKTLRAEHPGHQIRVRWRDPDDEAAGTEATKAGPAERPEVLFERAVTRTEYLDGFQSALPDATEIVVDELARAMIGVLRKIRGEGGSVT